MPLTSQLFMGDDKLEQCLVSNPHHVTPGSRGPHVAEIQQALIMLGEAVIGPDEIAGQFYGRTTARAVLAYKGPPRNIINKSYQNAADDIVGKMTIEILDREMYFLQKRPVSVTVAVTRLGSPHDHSLCPELQDGKHEGSPINPIGFKRKVNIYGEHETDYLGFRDYAVNPKYQNGRPMTWYAPERGGIGDGDASDICMRSTVPTDANDTRGTLKRNVIDEVKRIATHGCRLTYGGTTDNIATFGPRILRLGVLTETVTLYSPVIIDGKLMGEGRFIIYVLTIP